jgi:hypothetical protein
MCILAIPGLWAGGIGAPQAALRVRAVSERRGDAGHAAPMVIIWRNRRVNRILRPARNPRQTATFAISRLPAPIPHSPSIHRDA